MDNFSNCYTGLKEYTMSYKKPYNHLKIRYMLLLNKGVCRPATEGTEGGLGLR